MKKERLTIVYPIRISETMSEKIKVHRINIGALGRSGASKEIKRIESLPIEEPKPTMALKEPKSKRYVQGDVVIHKPSGLKTKIDTIDKDKGSDRLTYYLANGTVCKANQIKRAE